MQRVDLTKPGERKKLIWAIGLGLVAIVFLWWILFGFDSGTTTASRPQASPTPARGQQTARTGNGTPAPEPDVQNLAVYAPINYQPLSYSVPEAKRNIFSFYVPPPPPVKVSNEPTPTPTPPPPVLLASISPANVYARTADFKLEVAGDKFTPEMRIFVDGSELPTAYKSPQQLSATIPASFIVQPGARQVLVRTPDNRLYSDQLAINIAAPPTPNYSYIGIIGTPNRVDDIALVQDKGSKNVINANRGDVLSGRFRITSISEKELVLVDTTLKIKHTIAMSEADKGAGALSRPTPRVDAEDDEP